MPAVTAVQLECVPHPDELKVLVAEVVGRPGTACWRFRII